MALRRTAESAIGHFGCATGKWEVRASSPDYKRLHLTTLYEKPTVEYAKANMTVPGLQDGEYLTAFGLYIITETEALMKELEEQSATKTWGAPNVEPLQLTSALDAIRISHGLQGYLIDGERFDIGGDPFTYLDTLNALAPTRDTQIS
jgi:UTP--glucose-1-phosphate uridylyltransferase